MKQTGYPMTPRAVRARTLTKPQAKSRAQFSKLRKHTEMMTMSFSLSTKSSKKSLVAGHKRSKSRNAVFFLLAICLARATASYTHLNLEDGDMVQFQIVMDSRMNPITHVANSQFGFKPRQKFTVTNVVTDYKTYQICDLVQSSNGTEFNQVFCMGPFFKKLDKLKDTKTLAGLKVGDRVQCVNLEKYKKSSRVKLYNCCNDYSGLRNRGQYTVTKVRTAARTIAGFQLCDLKTDKKNVVLTKVLCVEPFFRKYSEDTKTLADHINDYKRLQRQQQKPVTYSGPDGKSGFKLYYRDYCEKNNHERKKKLEQFMAWTAANTVVTRRRLTDRICESEWTQQH